MAEVQGIDVGWDSSQLKQVMGGVRKEANDTGAAFVRLEKILDSATVSVTDYAKAKTLGSKADVTAGKAAAELAKKVVDHAKASKAAADAARNEAREVAAGGKVRDASGRFVKQHTAAEDQATRAQDRFRSAARKAANETRDQARANREAAASFSRFGAAIAGAIVGVVGINAIRDAARSAAEFGRGVAEISTLVDGTTAEIQAIGDEAKRMAVEFGSLPTGQVKAFYQVMSAGVVDATARTQMMLTANKLAVGGVANVEVAIDGLTNSMAAYGPAIRSATDASDAMFVAVRAGKTTVGELASTVGTIAPMAAKAGISFDALMASVAALTLQGLSTNVAMTGLSGILGAVVKPSQEAADLAKKLGIEFSFAGIEAKGWGVWLEDLKAKTGGSETALAVLMGGVEAIRPAMALTGEGGKILVDIMGQMEKKAGSSEAAFRKLAASPAFRMDQFKAMQELSKLSMGEGFIAAAVPDIRSMGDVKRQMEEVSKAARELGEAAGKGFRLAASAAAFLADHIGGITAALAAYVAIRAPISIAAMVAQLIAAHKAGELAKTSILGLNAAVLKSPFGVVTIAVVALGAAIWKLKSDSDAARETQIRYGEAVESLTPGTRRYIDLTKESTQAQLDHTVAVRKDIEAEVERLRARARVAQFSADPRTGAPSTAARDVDAALQTATRDLARSRAAEKEKRRLLQEEAKAQEEAAARSSEIRARQERERAEAGRRGLEASKALARQHAIENAIRESGYKLSEREIIAGSKGAKVKNELAQRVAVATAAQWDYAEAAAAAADAAVAALRPDEGAQEAKRQAEEARRLAAAIRERVVVGEVAARQEEERGLAMKEGARSMAAVNRQHEVENALRASGIKLTESDIIARSIGAAQLKGEAEAIARATEARVDAEVAAKKWSAQEEQVRVNLAASLAVLRTRAGLDAELAEARAALSRATSKVVVAETSMSERSRGLMSQLVGLGGAINLVTAAQLATSIEIDKTNAATARQTKINDRARAVARDYARIQAEVADALNGTTVATRALAAQEQAEAQAKEDGHEGDLAYIARLRAENEALAARRVEAEHTIEAYQQMAQMTDGTWSALRQTAVQTLFEGGDWEKAFGETLKRLGAQWADFLLELAQKALMQRFVLNATAGGGGGGVGDIASIGLGGAGGGGWGGQAINVAAQIPGSGGGAGGGGTGAMTNSGYAAALAKFMKVGGGALIGFAAAAAILAFTKWYGEKKERKFYDTVRVDPDSGGNPYTVGGSGAFSDRVLQAHKITEEIRSQIRQIMDMIFAEGMVDLPQLTIRAQRSGKSFGVWIGETLIGYFSTIEDAMAAAVRAAFQHGDLSRLPLLVQAAIARSSSATIEEFQGLLQQAQQISDLGMSGWMQRLRDIEQQSAQWRRSLDEILQAQWLRPGDAGYIPGRGGSGNTPPFRPSASGDPGLTSFGKDARYKPESARNEAERNIEAEEARQIRDLVDDVFQSLGDRTVDLRRRSRSVAEALQFLEDNMERLGLTAEEVARISRETGTRLTMDFAGQLLEFTGNAADRRKLEAMQWTFRRAELLAEFELIKALGVLTADELAYIQGLINGLPGGNKPPRQRGGAGRGQERDAFREQLREITERGLSDLTRGYRDYQRELAEVREESARLKISTEERLAAERALGEEFRRGVRERSAELGGRGPNDFEQRLQEGMKFFADLMAIPRGERGMPDWQVGADQSAFLGGLGAEIKAAVAEFSGFVDPMIAIRLQTADLTKSLAAYAKAAGLSAEETARMQAAIEAGAAFQTRQAGLSILGDLLSYVEDDAKWSKEAAAIAKEEVEIRFALVEMEMKALGMWEKYQKLFEAARSNAIAGTTGGGYSPTIISYKDWWAGGEDAAKTQQDAANRFKEAVDKWAEATKRLQESYDTLTYDNELSGLSARQQAEEARKRAEDAAAAARGGDVEARAAAGGFYTDYLREFIDAFGRGEAYFAEEARVKALLAALIDQPYTQGNVVAGPWRYPAPVDEPGSGGSSGTTEGNTSGGVSGGGGTSSATDQQRLARIESVVEQLAAQITALAGVIRTDINSRQQRDARQTQQTDVLLGRLGGLVDVMQRWVAAA